MIYRVLVIDIYDVRGDSKSSLFVSLLTIVFFVLTREKRKRFNQAKSAKIWSDSESYFSSPMWQWCIHLWDFLSLCFFVWKLRLIGATLRRPASARLFCNKSCDWSVLWQHSRLSFSLAIKNRFNEQNKNVINADIPKNKTRGAKKLPNRGKEGCWLSMVS